MKDEEKRLLEEWRQILVQFLDPMDMVDELPDYFPIGSPQYIEVCSERRNSPVAVKNLLKSILNTGASLQEFLGAIRRCKHDWLATLISGKIEAEEVEEAILQREKLTTVRHILTLISSHIKDTIVATDMANLLRNNLVISEDDFELIETQSKNSGNRVAVRALLSVLVRKPPGWWNGFLQAMRNLGYDYNLIDSFESLIFDEKTSTRASGDLPEKSGVLLESKSEDDEAIPNRGVIPRRIATMAANLSPDKPERKSKVLKKHQEQLALEAINGKNVIICAPHCSEKTKVASYILYTRFNQQILQSQDPRIAFIVSQDELVKHHYDIIKSYLSEDPWCIEYLVNSKRNITMESALLSSNVIVTTPQILITAFNDGSLSSLTRFKMIVFDECHLTTKENPYNNIMSRYRDLKHKENANLPQIIGLTATLGLDGSKSNSSNVERLLMLCANLDANGGIVTDPVKDQGEPKNFTPQSAKEDVSLEVAKDRFTMAICNAIDEIRDNGARAELTHSEKVKESIDLVQHGSIKILVCTQQGANRVSSNLGSDCKLAIVPQSRIVAKRDEANISKAALMDVTARIQKMYRSEPKKYFEELKRLQNRYKVLCRSCGKKACTSTDIELLDTMHTFDATAFKDKFVENKVDHGGSEEKKGLFCSTCGLKWGIFHKHMDIRIPLLSAKAFKFVLEGDLDDAPLTGKQWINIKIVFRKVTYEELAERLTAALQGSSSHS